MRTRALFCVPLVLSCVRVPNPNFVDEAGGDTIADDESGTGFNGDGDGDPSGDGDGAPTGDGDGDGDGDGEPVGDGDGDPSGDGDGDGDCVPGEVDCLCDVLETCNDGLACVLGGCVDADSCEPVNDAVVLSAEPTWGGADPPVAPTEPVTAICVLDGQAQGGKAVFNVHSCSGTGVLAELELEVQPIVEPIVELLGDPDLAATVTIVENDQGLFVRIEANGLDLYYVKGTSVIAEGVTEYPWGIAAFSSSCGQTPSMCGDLERLALLVDGGIVFDGNAEQASDAATVWAETVVEECDVHHYELALLAY